MLASLRPTIPDAISHEIILVDDCSTDETPAWLGTLGSPFQVRINERNLGYAGTCNHGASIATGEFLMFLNNDLLFNEGWLEPMLEALQKDRRYGAVGNRHYRMDDNTLDHAGVMVNTKGNLCHMRVPSADSGVTEVAAISAATLLLRRSLFERIGGFNEKFFNGGEDIDLSFRVQGEGLKCGIVQDSSVRHHISASRGRVRSRDVANTLLLQKKWPEIMLFFCALTWAKEQQIHLKKPWTLKGWRAWLVRSFALGKTKKPPAFLRKKIEIVLRQRISLFEQILAEDPP